MSTGAAPSRYVRQVPLPTVDVALARFASLPMDRIGEDRKRAVELLLAHVAQNPKRRDVPASMRLAVTLVTGIGVTSNFCGDSPRLRNISQSKGRGRQGSRPPPGDTLEAYPDPRQGVISGSTSPKSSPPPRSDGFTTPKGRELARFVAGLGPVMWEELGIFDRLTRDIQGWEEIWRGLGGGGAKALRRLEVEGVGSERRAWKIGGAYHEALRAGGIWFGRFVTREQRELVDLEEKGVLTELERSRVRGLRNKGVRRHDAKIVEGQGAIVRHVESGREVSHSVWGSFERNREWCEWKMDQVLEGERSA